MPADRLASSDTRQRRDAQRSSRLPRAVLAGTDVLVAGAVTVLTSKAKAGMDVMTARQAGGGTLGHLSISSIVDGVSFKIQSSSASDTSTVLWEILEGVA